MNSIVNKQHRFEITNKREIDIKLFLKNMSDLIQAVLKMKSIDRGVHVTQNFDIDTETQKVKNISFHLTLYCSLDCIPDIENLAIEQKSNIKIITQEY